MSELVVLSGEWLGNLASEIVDADYCYVCGEHPSHGHRDGCPMSEAAGEPVRRTE